MVTFFCFLLLFVNNDEGANNLTILLIKLSGRPVMMEFILFPSLVHICE
jgi:hypothetical protein